MPPLSVVNLLLAELATLHRSVLGVYARRVTFSAAGSSVTTRVYVWSAGWADYENKKFVSA
jgi:hypothetical protein